MGRRKYNLCTKCGFRHAAPTGNSCTVCAAGDGAQLPDDKSISGGQGPNLEGLDAHDYAQCRQKAVQVVERVETIEKDIGAMDGKLDLIIANMKKPSLSESEGEEIVDGWTKDNSEAWEETKSRGRTRDKLMKPKHKPRSSSSSSRTIQSEGETKQFDRKQFVPKDHKVKRSAEIIHVCVKTLEKVINEKMDPIRALKHLKFMSDKVAKGCFNFEAISGYDDAVRARVALEGYGEFAKIETDFEIAGQIQNGRGSASKRHMSCYISAEGCTGKCYFIHKCSECDSRQHGKKDCKKSK